MTKKPTYEELEQRVKDLEKESLDRNQAEQVLKSERNITERVKAEEDLHKYERIVAASNDHMSLIDRNYVYQVVNDAYLRSHNVKREDIIGHSVPELFGQEFFETHQKPMIDRCLAGEVARYQSWIDFPTLGRRYMDIAHYPYFEDDGSISCYVVNAHDITERKQAEEALRESEEKYRMLFNSTNDAVFVHQPNPDRKLSKFIEVNDVACKVYGYTRQELLELTTLDLVIPELKEDARMRLRSLFSDKYSVFEIVHKTKNGNEIPVEISAHLFDFYGQPTVLSLVRDITDRKRAEYALRESEEKYRLLADNVTDVIWVRDMNLHTTFISPSVKEQQGYTVEEAMNRTLEEILTPGSFKLIGEVFAEELEIERGNQKGTQRSWTIEVEINCKDSSTIWAEIKMSFLRDNNGKPIGVIGVTRNITERKQAEEALREREATLRSIFRAAPTGIGMVFDRVIKQANDRLCEMLGYSRGELLEKSARMLYPTDEDFEYVGREKYAQIRERGTGTVETRWQRKDGKVIDVLLSSTPLDPNDLSIGVTFTALDITARKLSEEALRESKEKYQTVLEANPDPVVVYDIEGKVTYFNPAFTRVFGWTLKECLGKKMDIFVHEEAWPETKMMIDKVQAGESFSGIVTSRYTKEGKSIPVSVSGAIYRDRDGNPMGSVVNLRDISEQKQLQAQLQQSQKMESIGTLAGGIAHDFNNILSPIILYTEMVLEDISEKGPLRFSLEEILRASMRAKDLVKQILTFSRQTEQEKIPLIISPIVKEALKLLRSSLPSTIEIRQNIEAEDSVVLADPTQIHQILMNIGTNAANAMRDRGGVLEVSLVDVDLHLDDTDHAVDLEPGQYIKLTVSDTGHGIEPAIMDKIFDPYFTTQEKGKGTGLGLSVVHGIVNSHGGHISAYSEPDKRTRFDVYLPLFDLADIKAETVSPEKLTIGNEHILLVDDEKPIVDVVQQMLERLGYQVTVRTSSIEALEVFRALMNKFDLVITDLTMPNMTGDKLAGELMNIRPDIPIILCTGFSEKMSKERAEALGIKGFLMKPIVKNDIAKTVREVLDKS